MPSQRHAKAAASTTKQKTASTPTLIPDWPLLQPLVPSEDLALEVLLQDQIIVIRNLFTSTLCKHYVSFLSSLPLVTTPAKPKHGEALRVNDRFEVHDPAFAERLWNSTALKHLVTGVGRQDEEQMDRLPKDLNDLWGGESCGLNPRIRIYRYRKGQFFGQHYDESQRVTLSTPAQTTWTLLIYLTGPATGCLGGETVFYPDPGPAKAYTGEKPTEQQQPLVVGLEVGMALLHRHGEECMLHEGRRVLEGEKWVIRSDVCVRR